jgi:hypothetical protein
VLCRLYGAAPTVSQSALEDARAAARLCQALLQDAAHLRQEVFHRAPMPWPTWPVPRVNLVNRSAARLGRQQPPSFLKKLVERASLVPSPERDDGAEIASGATRDRAC